MIDYANHVRWYVGLRWFLLLAVSGPGLLAVVLIEGWTWSIQRDIALVVLALASNGLFHFLARLKKGWGYYSKLAIALLIIDLLLITYLVYMKGGVESRSMILYAVPILMSAPIFGRRGIYAIALSSMALYSIVLLGGYFDVLSNVNTRTDLQDNTAYMINTILFFSLILLLIGFMADYIVRLLTQKQQRAIEIAEALKRAQRIAKLGSWEWDLRTNEIDWSEEMRRLLGEKEDRAFKPKDFFKYAYKEDREQIEEVVRAALESKQSFTMEYRIRRPGKEPLLVHGEGEVIVDENGNPIKMFGTSRDVTHERALEHAKGDFVSLASHQLRTPATGVKVLLSLLIDGYVGELKKDQMEMIQKAYDINERQLRIANDLLTIASLEAGKFMLRKQSVNLTSWLPGAVESQKPIISQRNQTLTVQVPKQPIKTEVDCERLELVLDNLISNASKYTPEGGHIAVILRKRNKFAMIAVKDTGVGIAEKEFDKLFRKFSRIDTNWDTEVEGTGLGLYLAKSIMDLHGGDIRVSSRLGQGTTFTILVPLP